MNNQIDEMERPRIRLILVSLSSEREVERERQACYRSSRQRRISRRLQRVG
jgi:hypothetical protein